MTFSMNLHMHYKIIIQLQITLEIALFSKSEDFWYVFTQRLSGTAYDTRSILKHPLIPEKDITQGPVYCRNSPIYRWVVPKIALVQASGIDSDPISFNAMREDKCMGG